jgi:hypothetical protein
MLCGGKDFKDMEVLGKAKYDWLKNLLDFRSGVPDSDTFRRTFDRVDSQELAAALNKWLNSERDKRVASIDGRQ